MGTHVSKITKIWDLIFSFGKCDSVWVSECMYVCLFVCLYKYVHCASMNIHNSSRKKIDIFLFFVDKFIYVYQLWFERDFSFKIVVLCPLRNRTSVRMNLILILLMICNARFGYNWCIVRTSSPNILMQIVCSFF